MFSIDYVTIFIWTYCLLIQRKQAKSVIYIGLSDLDHKQKQPILLK
jgi:hypothetical protein